MNVHEFLAFCISEATAALQRSEITEWPPDGVTIDDLRSRVGQGSVEDVAIMLRASANVAMVLLNSATREGEEGLFMQRTFGNDHAMLERWRDGFRSQADSAGLRLVEVGMLFAVFQTVRGGRASVMRTARAGRAAQKGSEAGKIKRAEQARRTVMENYGSGVVAIANGLRRKQHSISKSAIARYVRENRKNEAVNTGHQLKLPTDDKAIRDFLKREGF